MKILSGESLERSIKLYSLVSAKKINYIYVLQILRQMSIQSNLNIFETALLIYGQYFPHSDTKMCQWIDDLTPVEYNITIEAITTTPLTT